MKRVIRPVVAPVTADFPADYAFITAKFSCDLGDGHPGIQTKRDVDPIETGQPAATSDLACRGLVRHIQQVTLANRRGVGITQQR